MATRKTTATKAKQEAEPETPADAVAPNAEQEAQADAKATEPTPEKVTETPSPADAVAPDAEQISTDSTPTEIPGDVIIGDGTGNALPPIEEAEIDAVMVRTKRRIKSRRRAGHRFNREGTAIALELLTQEQVKQLFNDPALEAMYCTIPVEGISEQES
ncbi:MAG: hypothetical protein COA87_007850 [Halomonas sp.]|nr:hypothetical protein [Halomonas sp.]MBL1267648.1 hypothetical protein [Halomonas sp.]